MFLDLLVVVTLAVPSLDLKRKEEEEAVSDDASKKNRRE